MIRGSCFLFFHPVRGALAVMTRDEKIRGAYPSVAKNLHRARDKNVSDFALKAGRFSGRFFRVKNGAETVWKIRAVFGAGRRGKNKKICIEVEMKNRKRKLNNNGAAYIDCACGTKEKGASLWGALHFSKESQ